jgi:hypothetical protein
VLSRDVSLAAATALCSGSSDNPALHPSSTGSLEMRGAPRRAAEGIEREAAERQAEEAMRAAARKQVEAIPEIWLESGDGRARKRRCLGFGLSASG